ncbi:DNA-binding transcriptional repressor FabR [Variibacter gotjawalensis]|uniref:DNA-binding transcriptional repressor FabR n=1 Tax=Variibacter gotjawalensis TaxID=1333996 RepID=A0A0S3PR53_9BRAD|nr:TetR/AcrR family transcriptional regulator [Variibacter gotjawalensis]NIK48656.1 AcrR family transcriptional regulator [Variibacter gotjawalensis]RZS50517.1 TetR family transcriptional regulator [Variibacter gotjawalensis]BAT58352.1 DNA-binding transcriptional repressor FabR [Variibacter gotjawalensis]
MTKKAPTAGRQKKLRTTYRHGDLQRTLIAAGVALARAGGPDAVVLREVTRQAGVAPNAAYRHFKSRDELLEGVRAASLAALAAAIERATALEIASLGAVSSRGAKSVTPSQQDFARARLRAVGAGYLRFAREETGLFRTAFTPGARGIEHVADPERAGPSGLNPFELLSAALDAMAASGILPPERRPNAEYLAWSSVHGMAMLSIEGPLVQITQAEYAALAQSLLAMVERGLS